MAGQAYTKEIINDLISLPDDKIREVKDFVQFLKSRSEKLSLKKAGLSKEEAASLRSRLSTFEDDWNASGMEEYDKL